MMKFICVREFCPLQTTRYLEHSYLDERLASVICVYLLTNNCQQSRVLFIYLFIHFQASKKRSFSIFDCFHQKCGQNSCQFTLRFLASLQNGSVCWENSLKKNTQVPFRLLVGPESKAFDLHLNYLFIRIKVEL